MLVPGEVAEGTALPLLCAKPKCFGLELKRSLLDDYAGAGSVFQDRTRQEAESEIL